MNLFIDRGTWRCGTDYADHHGRGLTTLLNSDGYMCCLGQFSRQAGISDEELLGVERPSDLSDEAAQKLPQFMRDDELMATFMIINDLGMDRQTREDKLKTLGSDNGLNIIFMGDYNV